jgi:transcriptional regulator with XRE-family HTH domain
LLLLLVRNLLSPRKLAKLGAILGWAAKARNYAGGNRIAAFGWGSLETMMESLSEVTAGEQKNRLGALLREWRGIRGKSQLDLALDAQVSQRHLSFIESGRSRPSREMVLTITEALDLPLRARNDLLAAAGFAAFYPERPLDATEMKRAREALARILEHHEPYPSMVLDRSWNIVMKNKASARIVERSVSVGTLAKLAPDGRLNFMRVMFAPDGMRPRVKSWERTAPILIARLRREAAAYPDSPSEALLRELLPNAPSAYIPGLKDAPLAPTVPLELETEDGELRLFNTLTTFGTPQDVTLQELRIEMSYPADDSSDALLRRWAG